MASEHRRRTIETIQEILFDANCEKYDELSETIYDIVMPHDVDDGIRMSLTEMATYLKTLQGNLELLKKSTDAYSYVPIRHRTQELIMAYISLHQDLLGEDPDWQYTAETR